MEKEDHTRPKDTYKKEKDVRLDRHSAQGVDPNPKKGGYGGWGVAGQDDTGVQELDQNDPNYQPPEEEKKQEV